MRLVFTVTLDLTDGQLDDYSADYGHRRNEVPDALAQHLDTTLHGDTLGQRATVTVTQVDTERAVGPCECGAPHEGVHAGRIAKGHPEHAYSGPIYPFRRACCGENHQGWPCR